VLFITLGNETLFEQIGEQDITIPCNFFCIKHWGAKFGLETCGFTDQAHFLMGLGIEEYLKICTIKIR